MSACSLQPLQTFSLRDRNPQLRRGSLGRLPVESNLPMKTFEQIAELERRYLLGTYNRYPIVLARGKGVFVYDIENRRYLDFVSGLGVNALGHAHPRIVKTIREQAGKLIHVSNLYYHEYQGALAEKLCTLLGSS